MKTAKEMGIAIGQRCGLALKEGLIVEVEVLDVRQVYNRLDCLVRPIAGSGQAWVSFERLRLSPASEQLVSDTENLDSRR